MGLFVGTLGVVAPEVAGIAWLGSIAGFHGAELTTTFKYVAAGMALYHLPYATYELHLRKNRNKAEKDKIRKEVFQKNLLVINIIAL